MAVGTHEVRTPATDRPAPDRVRVVTEQDVPDLARGCAVLGAGGGGSVETAVPGALQAVQEHGPVPLAGLDDLADDAVVLVLSAIGAPTVGHEMLPSREQPVRLRDEVERLLGRPVAAVMAAEIGGSNGVAPVAWAAQIDVPLVDADAMGRAFPESQMVTLNVAGLPPSPVVLADVLGNVAVLHPVDPTWAERHARALCVASGSSAMLADWTLTAGEARGAVVDGSVSSAIRIGRAARSSGDPVAALREVLGAVDLVEGKVADVDRRTGGGFVRGSVSIDGTGEARGRTVRVELQNENLVVLEDGEVLASVPDLVSIVDAQTGDAIPTELVRFGQRVRVLAWPCDPIWRTPRGLEIAGPRAFGYEVDFRPVEELHA